MSDTVATVENEAGKIVSAADEFLAAAPDRIAKIESTLETIAEFAKAIHASWNLVFPNSVLPHPVPSEPAVVPPA